jgi:hypothetical protein
VLVLGGALVVLAAVVLGLAQALLPGIAAQRVRSEVGGYGTVRSVSVSATPALELAWGQAERIAVRAGALRISPEQLVGLEQRLGGVTEATLESPTVELVLSSVVSGNVTLHEVLLRKRGNVLSAHATVSAGDVHVQLPAGLELAGLESAEGLPRMTVRGGLAGVSLTANALVGALEGKLVAQPVGIPLAGLATVTVFADRRVYVQSVTLSPGARGYGLTIIARRAD